MTVLQRFFTAALASSITLASSQAKGDETHAVLRLGQRGQSAVVLGCLTDTEANARAPITGRPFGWQFKSDEFSCHSGTTGRLNVTATCIPKGDEPRFIDFFFPSVRACRNFEAAILPSCADQLTARCLDFMEDYFTPRNGLI